MLQTYAHSHTTMHMSTCEILYGREGKIAYACEGNGMGARAKWQGTDFWECVPILG